MVVNFISTNTIVQSKRRGTKNQNFPTPISQYMYVYKRISWVQPPLHLRSRLRSKDFGVFVNARHKAQAYSSSNGFRDLALVDRSQSSFGRVFDTAHLGHILGHDGEILV